MTLSQLALILSRYDLRCFYDRQQRTQWFCAVDICAMLYDTTTYQQAKNHWKNAKRRLPRFDQRRGYVATQLSLPAKNGRFYMMDVLTAEDVHDLLQTIARGKNTACRCRCKHWLALFSPKKILQAICERGAGGYFELLGQARRAGKGLCMTFTRIAQVFMVGSEMPVAQALG